MHPHILHTQNNPTRKFEKKKKNKDKQWLPKKSCKRTEKTGKMMNTSLQ